jgi:hypothetical protein
MVQNNTVNLHRSLQIYLKQMGAAIGICNGGKAFNVLIVDMGFQGNVVMHDIPLYSAFTQTSS